MEEKGKNEFEWGLLLEGGRIYVHESLGLGQRPERRKWTSKKFFFSCKTGVVRISNCRNGWVFFTAEKPNTLSNIPRRSIGALKMD